MRLLTRHGKTSSSSPDASDNDGHDIDILADNFFSEDGIGALSATDLDEPFDEASLCATGGTMKPPVQPSPLPDLSEQETGRDADAHQSERGPIEMIPIRDLTNTTLSVEQLEAPIRDAWQAGISHPLSVAMYTQAALAGTDTPVTEPLRLLEHPHVGPMFFNEWAGPADTATPDAIDDWQASGFSPAEAERWTAEGHTTATFAQAAIANGEQLPPSTHPLAAIDDDTVCRTVGSIIARRQVDLEQALRLLDAPTTPAAPEPVQVTCTLPVGHDNKPVQTVAELIAALSELPEDAQVLPLIPPHG